jgi:hypothetical protein
MQTFGHENRRRKGHFQNLGVDGTIIFKRLLRKLDKTAWTGFMQVSQETNKCWALDNTVMNLRGS